MKSLIYRGQGLVEFAEVPDPVPRVGDATVRIEASAICGSERHGLLDGIDGNGGHEACGTVIHPGRSGFRAGDRVGLSAVVGCGQCERCVVGEQIHCRQGWAPGGDAGWHAEFAAVRPSALYEIPEGVDPGLGVLLTGDSLGVPVRGVRQTPSSPGDEVVIIGLGPVGLGHLIVRVFAGATVTAIEPSPYRRELAARLGATTVVEPGTEIIARPKVVIECTGRPECVHQAFDLVDNGGIVLQSGECDQDVPINPSAMVIRREITYTGSWYFTAEDYPVMRDMLAAGLPLESMRTHELPAQGAQSGVDEFLVGKTGKVVLRWDDR